MARRPRDLPRLRRPRRHGRHRRVDRVVMIFYCPAGSSPTSLQSGHAGTPAGRLFQMGSLDVGVLDRKVRSEPHAMEKEGLGCSCDGTLAPHHLTFPRCGKGITRRKPIGILPGLMAVVNEAAMLTPPAWRNEKAAIRPPDIAHGFGRLEQSELGHSRSPSQPHAGHAA